ncbi:MAG: putative Outer rane lipoprotein carrier protein LolA [Nitrospira sp.]|jgi:outer membrane lipoprotein carrier protein|nr:putative Outer rane lipoprotein carrier protein LolA [Nitrospira sp.]
MMRTVSICALVFLGGVLAVSQPVTADEPPVDEQALQEALEVVKKIQARYEKTKDLQASFTQKTRIEGFSTPVISTGRFYIKKPGRLRWDYIEPATEEIYVNKDDVKMYVPEHKQVLVGKLTYMAASQAPLQLLQGVAKLDEEFDIAPAPDKERGAGGIPLLSLTPKQGRSEPERAIQRIVVEVQPKTYFLKTIALHEVTGNIATFEFSELKPNSGLKDDLFDFKTPADVEVVRAPVLSRP